MFDNLLPGSMYEIVVVAGINVLDKDNYDPVVIYEYQFKTKEIINILNINNLEDSVNILINPLFSKQSKILVIIIRLSLLVGDSFITFIIS